MVTWPAATKVFLNKEGKGERHWEVLLILFQNPFNHFLVPWVFINFVTEIEKTLALDYLQ